MSTQLQISVGDKLIEKISDAVGILYDPYGIKGAYRNFVKKLLQEVGEDATLSYAEKIGLVQEISVLLKKNKNRHKIIGGAQPLLKETSQPESMDESWIVSFWDKCGSVSDDNFQSMWSQILAQEVNEPSTISKRLLHNFSLMSTTDANNFINLAKFCFIDKYDNNIAQPIVYIKEDPDFYASQGIYSHVLKELELFSLIETNYDTGFAFNKKKVLSYMGNTLEITASRIPIGNVRLTIDGQKLLSIITKTTKERILDYTVEKLQYKNCDVKVSRSTKVEKPYDSKSY